MPDRLKAPGPLLPEGKELREVSGQPKVTQPRWQKEAHSTACAVEGAAAPAQREHCARTGESPAQGNPRGLQLLPEPRAATSLRPQHPALCPPPPPAQTQVCRTQALCQTLGPDPGGGCRHTLSPSHVETLGHNLASRSGSQADRAGAALTLTTGGEVREGKCGGEAPPRRPPRGEPDWPGRQVEEPSG